MYVHVTSLQAIAFVVSVFSLCVGERALRAGAFRWSLNSVRSTFSQAMALTGQKLFGVPIIVQPTMAEKNR